MKAKKIKYDRYFAQSFERHITLKFGTHERKKCYSRCLAQQNSLACARLRCVTTCLQTFKLRVRVSLWPFTEIHSLFISTIFLEATSWMFIIFGVLHTNDMCNVPHYFYLSCLIYSSWSQILHFIVKWYHKTA